MPTRLLFALGLVTLGNIACASGHMSSSAKGAFGASVASDTNLARHAVAIIDKNGPACSGSLISRRHVLTAAHCAKILESGWLKVAFGTNAYEAVQNGKTIDVKHFWIPQAALGSLLPQLFNESLLQEAAEQRNMSADEINKQFLAGKKETIDIFRKFARPDDKFPADDPNFSLNYQGLAWDAAAKMIARLALQSQEDTNAQKDLLALQKDLFAQQARKKVYDLPDLGILELSQDAPDTYEPVNRDAAVVPANGQDIVLAGYGVRFINRIDASLRNSDGKAYNRGLLESVQLTAAGAIGKDQSLLMMFPKKGFPCKVDSGSPIYVKDVSGDLTQVAIDKGGFPSEVSSCGIIEVATPIARFNNWIACVINDFSDASCAKAKAETMNAEEELKKARQNDDGYP